MSLHAPEERVAGLGGLGDPPAFTPAEPPWAPPRARAREDAAALEHRERVLEAGGSGLTGPDAMVDKIVAHDVREHQGADAGGAGEAGQAPALEAREVLAHHVELVDRGSRLHQESGGAGLVAQGEALGGRGEQRRGAPRQKQQDEVVLRPGPAAGPPPRPPRAGRGRRGGDGPLSSTRSRPRPRASRVRDHEAGLEPRAQDVARRLGHGGGGLAHGQENDAPFDAQAARRRWRAPAPPTRRCFRDRPGRDRRHASRPQDRRRPPRAWRRAQ